MQLLNRVLIEIENKINEQMLVYKAMAKISTDKTVASDILSMLVNLRFEYDFRLINNAVDIQNLYSTIVKFNPDERNDCIRFLLDLADDVFLIASNSFKETLPVSRINLLDARNEPALPPRT